MQTKAAVLYEQGKERPYTRSQPLAIETVELDDPKDGELLVEIAAAGLCHSDLSTIEGIRPRRVPQRDVPRFLELYKQGKLPVDKLRGGFLALDDINTGFDRLAEGDVVRQILNFSE